MTPEEALKQGEVQTALQLLQDQIRNKPDDVKLRIFLFQLLCVLGQWDRALTQMNLAAEMDDVAIAMKVMYGQVLNSEVFREAVFRGEKDPVVFGKPQEWVALLMQALKLTAQGNHQQAAEVRARAFDAAPTTSGSIDGKTFEWIADADPRLGPVMEVIVEGRYMWAPFENIKSITIEEPEDLRDMVWLPAHFEWVNGGQSYALIPARYPESYRYDDDLVILSRKTEWEEIAPEFYIGHGLKLLATDADEYSVLDARQLVFDNEVSAEEGDTENTDG